MLALVPAAADIAAVSAAIVGLIAIARAVTGWKPVKFVWRRLVTEPIHDGLRAVVLAEITPRLEQHSMQLAEVTTRLDAHSARLADIQAELSYNGGGTVKDIARRTEGRVEVLEAFAQRGEDRAHQSDKRSKP